MDSKRRMMAISIVPEWSKILTVLSDPEVSEVEVNEPDRVFIKKNGQRVRLNISFRDETYYMDSIEQGLVPLVTSLSAFSPTGFLFEGRLNYRVGDVEVAGRCHVVLPPSSDFPQITIAKKSASLKNIESIAAAGSMSTEMMQFLQAAVQAQLTIVFSGGTGAGKDLSEKTPIVTPEGYVKMGDLKKGDIVFDESGKQVRVVNKYEPKDPVHYELTFNNGEKIRAGQGHLWKVLMLNEKPKFGYKTSPLFKDSEIDSMKSQLHGDDMVRFSELMAIIGRHGKDSFLQNLIQGFGIHGGDLISFRKNEIISKFSNIRSRNAKNVVEKLNKIEEDVISLAELSGIVNNRHLLARAIPESASMVNAVFYNKREVFNYLIRENDDRLKVREGLLKARSENERPVKLMTTEELFRYGAKNDNGRLNFAVESLTDSVEFNGSELPIDPYTLGAWLGDGYSASGNICGVDEEVFEKIRGASEVHFLRSVNGLSTYRVEGLHSNLRKNGLLNNKHIPPEYVYSSREDRVALISGLMDTDGTVDYRRGAAILEMTNEAIIRSAHTIVQSLGWASTDVNSRVRSYRDAEGNIIPCKDAYRFTFYPTEQIFNIPRKAEALDRRMNGRRIAQQARHARHYISSIKVVESDEKYYCIEVDSPSHMFLAGESLIPTHNTTMLEALSKSIPDNYRIGVAEDVPELNLQQSNVTYLHSVPWQPGMDENDVATLAWVVQQFQRMRTDKIIIGETRGKEFADFLVAANSGMEGSMTTIHAENPERCLSKMTGFALKGSERQPIRAINNDIANSVNLIVQLVIVDGKHRVSHIQEVTPTLGNTDEAKISTQPLYRWDREQDMFYKDAVMTDSMRQRMIDRHVPIDTFLHSQRELRQPAHGSTRREVQQQMSSGLPRGLPQRPAGGRSL